MKRIPFQFKLLTILLITLAFAVEGWSMSKEKPIDPALAGEAVYWYEKGVKKEAWMAMDEVAVLPEKGKAAQMNEADMIQQLHPEAVVTEKSNFVILLRMPEPIDIDTIAAKLSSVRSIKNIKQACPVFYTSKDRTPGSRLVLTGEIIVQFPAAFSENQIADIEKEYGLQRVKTFGFAPNTYLFQAGDPLSSLDVANRLSESGQVNFAYPDWLRSRVKRATPNDPLFQNQWHLSNTGQGGGTAGEDVNITSVWNTYRGSTSEVIAVVDDGMEIGHEDLTPNVLPGQSWDYVDGDNNPTAGDHGTSCAGVAAARGFNSIGVSGAAPQAGLVGYRLLGAGTDANEADALTRNNSLIDIYSNSWGPADNGQLLDGPGLLTESALQSGVANGRGGLGSIFVWAGGNGNDNDDNSNYDGYANSRYTIAVAASNNWGYRSGYSEKGANILVNAPSSGGSLGITTVDRSGTYGYDPGNYTAVFGGTSSACPLVSGIIALMLQAKPNLTWRDVQHILIETAEKNDPSDEDWATNAAGYPINHKYGFGRIAAHPAIIMALGWKSAEPETSTQGSSTPNLPIPDDNPNGVQNKIRITRDLYIEFVEIYFSAADHTYWGDLDITLTSPSGTKSILSETHSSGSTPSYNNWRFGSARHFGESSAGNWTLTVKDLSPADNGTFQSWTLKIYGTAANPATITPILPILLSDETTDTIQNGNFEFGHSDWTEYSQQSGYAVITNIFPTGVTPHSGSWAVWHGGVPNNIKYIRQSVTVSAASPYLTYYHWITSADSCGYDYGYVRINGINRDTLDLCSSTNTSAWVSRSINLITYVGQTVSLEFRSETDSTNNSNWFIDDVSFR